MSTLLASLIVDRSTLPRAFLIGSLMLSLIGDLSIKSVQAQSLETRCTTSGTGCAALLVSWMNAERAKQGIAPLTVGWTQSHCSAAHSRHMAQEGFISHDQWPSDLCTPYFVGGENVGMSGQPNKRDAIRQIHDLMMGEHPPDDGHHRNILDARFTRVGIGFARSRGGLFYLTEDLTVVQRHLPPRR